jgi:AraC-like DNA-binding protein
LEYAQSQLIATHKKIKHIAIEAGFENEMYFSRIFKKKVGTTPKAYRAAQKEPL